MSMHFFVEKQGYTIFVEMKNYHDYIRIIKENGFAEVNMEYTTNNHTV